MIARLNLHMTTVWRRILPTAALIIAVNACAADASLDQARALMSQGDARAAYALLESQEFDRAGDIEFDTLLGVAALDSGYPDRATLALERVLAIDPNAAGARLDLARAYFALGDLDRSRQELDVVSANNPPPAAQAVIDRYRAAIAERLRKKATTTTAYAEGFIGHDSNITSVVGDFGNAVLAAYNLAGFEPTGNSILRASSVAGLAGGVAVEHQIDNAWAFSGGVDARWRDVAVDSNYNSGELDARAAVSHTVGADTLRGGLVLQDFSQRTDVPSDDRNAVGVSGEWRHVIDDRNQASLFGVATRQRYPDVAVDDIDSIMTGASWLHMFDGAHHALLYANVMVGQENAQNLLANGADNSRHDAAGRLYAQWSANDRVDLFANIGMLQRSDRSMYARSTTVQFGNDHLSDATAGCNWRPATQWTIRPQITYSENRSNVALSEFRRTELTLTVRYDWR